MEHMASGMGPVIRELRKAGGYTQDALAQAAGVSIQAVSKWETGQSLPDVTLLPAIADFLGISVDTLFGRTAEQKQEEQEASVSLFPDDGRLRVVQYLGSRLLSPDECTDGQEIPLRLDAFAADDKRNIKMEIEIQGSARIIGPVNGALNVSGDAAVQGNLNGSAQVLGNLTCEGSISGSVRTAGGFTPRAAETSSTVRVETVGDSLSGLKESLSGLGSMVSSLFGGRRTGSSRGQWKAFFSGDLPDDEVIRVVQLQGQRILSAEESDGKKVIPLSVSHLTSPLNVEIFGSARIEGDIRGNASAGDGMTCLNVGGSASAGDSLTCADVKGNVNAGDGVRCGPVGGSVRAGDSVHITGDVIGSVTASDSVTCGNIGGNVRADSVKHSGTRSAQRIGQPLPDVSGFSDSELHIVQVMNGEILSDDDARANEPLRVSLEEADGASVHIHGSAQIDGDVSGSIRAAGSVTCGDVEGDVTAGGQVSCADVEGDVSAGRNITCATVEGNVHVQGNSDQVSVTCAEIEGNLTAVNASVTCEGTIGGSLDVRCDIPTVCSIDCEGVEGDVTAVNASVTCEGTIGGSVHIRGDMPYACSIDCEGVEGDVTAVNASVHCGNGSIGGNVEAKGEV